MSTFIQAGVECHACGHVFDVRRRCTSAGYVVGTHCPDCKGQSNIYVPDTPPVRARRLRESDIEDRLVRRVRELGGEVRKVEWIGRRGAPDRLVMLPASPFTIAELCAWFKISELMAAELVAKAGTRPGRAIWVELKAPGKAALFPRNAHEHAQHREHERMRNMGQVVHVIDSFEAIERILK